MSANLGQIPVELPPMGSVTAEQAAVKSLTHWVWTPYVDINNMQAWGINSLLGYRGQAWSLFKRCTPYPLSNMIQEDVDRATVAEMHASGLSLGPQASPKIQFTKYAQEQANELGETYGNDHGLRVLVPFIGMDDAELVNRVIQVVQPFAYLIHEMALEFTSGAKDRIADSNLSKDERQAAVAVAKIMLNGSERAKIRATTEYRALITSMSDASIGKPGISEPNDFHEWICIQLDKPVPKRINRMEQQETHGGGMDQGLIKALLERDAERAKELDALKLQVAEQAAKRGPGRPPINRDTVEV